jgi:lipid A disaccharide synthetase
MNTGELMSIDTQCSLGIISNRDMELVKSQYLKLQNILSTMRTKIDKISKEDATMNERLMNEYNLLQSNLNKYEKTYKEIRDVHKLSKHSYALYEDSTLQMNSRNSKFIIWSILALTVAYITMKYIR